MSNKVRRDNTVGFALSFLDVLCCGLGASILLLMIVKHGASVLPLDSVEDIAAREAKIAQTLDEKLAAKSALEAELLVSSEAINMAVLKKEKMASAQSDQVEELRAQLSALSQARDDLTTTKDVVLNLQLERDAKFVEAAEEVEDEELGQTGQLGGIQVDNDYVVVLLDRSASMLDHSLVEIIRLRVADPYYRKTAPKWVTAKNTAIWGFKHIEDSNHFQLFSFSDTVLDVEGNEIDPKDPLEWRVRGETGNTIADIVRGVQATDANGPTNLERAFSVLTKLSPAPRQVLLITDGLPSVPGEADLRTVRNCRSSARGNKLLTPECRQEIFNRARDLFKQTLGQTDLNIVLLPLEGDARATRLYWNLASARNGRVLAPAPNWPPL